MKKAVLLLSIFISITSSLSAQMTTRVVADNLFIPWEMVYAPDSNIWFTQKNGYICRLKPSTGFIDTIYHEPQTKIIKEGGMLGMVLHPNFPTDPYVYVAYNYDNSGTYTERIIRLTYSGNTLGNPLILLDNISGAQYHNGCRLTIANNHLYITTGDATTQSISQDITKINGKVLRINLDGTIPSDNPFAGSPVWSWGHRNAQGLIFANGMLYSSEHGPQTDDEFNIIQKGRNFGWPNVAGLCNTSSEITFCNDSNVVEPLKAWTPTIAVSSIAWYNHPMFPGLKGSVLMTTLKDRQLYELELNSSFDQITNTKLISQISGDRLRAICVDPDGRIYISTSNSKSSGDSALTDKIIEIYDPNYNRIAEILKQSGQIIAVYPNPAKHEINIYANISQGDSEHKYAIINTSGQVISKGHIYAGSNTISLTSQATGVYWLKVTNASGLVNSTKFNKL